MTRPPEDNYHKYLQMLGRRVAAARHLRGEKEDTVAKAVGITQAVISQVENGTYYSLKVTTLIDICEYLQMQLPLLPPPLL